MGSRSTILRWVVAATLLGVVASVDTSVALAQTGDNEGAWNKFMKTIGLKSSTEPDTDINYTERSPLVVPPNRDLPPPRGLKRRRRHRTGRRISQAQALEDQKQGGNHSGNRSANPKSAFPKKALVQSGRLVR